ncbi:MAG: MEKHLA domain-containing protein [Rhodobacteraceae bacterium PARR1]|nr:MAG: MEKHLA domain-containing protein [Rhodobacteraceae bacterium PARR1]
MPDSAATRAYARLLAESFSRVLGRDLIAGCRTLDDAALAAGLRDMAAPIVSHGTEADPVFRYANTAALTLWQMDWGQFTRLPSRLSAEAEPDIQGDRARLLADALAKGWVGDYQGIRISATGRRFMIRDTVLWTVTDAQGIQHGQAALIGRVEPLG